MKDTKKKVMTETLDKLNQLSESKDPKDYEKFLRIIGIIEGIMIGVGANV